MDNPFKAPVILSLCPGILGLERGLERAIGPIRVAAYCEREAFICENLVAGMEAGILAPAPIWTDVKTFPAEPFRGKVHGIIGGYPCQPFSTAGKRGGAEDERHLFPHILRHIRAIRPIWCFFENVRGHLTMGYDEVYRSLRGAGYAVECGIYSAEEIGAPHRRDRLFILAILDDSLRKRLSSEWRNGRIETGLRKSGKELADADSNGPRADSSSVGCQGGSDENSEQRKERDDIQREWRGGYPGNIGTEVAYTYFSGQSDQRHHGKPDGQENDRVINAGSAGVGLADSCCERLEERGEQFTRGEQPPFKRSSAIMGNSKGLPEREQADEIDPFPGGRGTWNEFSRPSDRWPARSGEQQYDWEAPRTIESGMGCSIDGYNFREDLLRALGNSVVEQQAEYAFRDLMRKHGLTFKTPSA